MGSSSSRDERRVRNHQSPPVVRQQQQQQQTIQTTMPYHLQQQFRQAPPPVAQAAPNSVVTPSRPAGVQEGLKIKMLATVEISSVHYVADCNLLTFRVTSQTPQVSYEVHVAVRETVRDGTVIYTPNKPKVAPEQVILTGEQDDCEIAVQVDLKGVEEQELKFNKHYPKQKPCVIVLRYKDAEGAEHSEHTSVDLSNTARRTVIDQVVQTQGSCYAVESLFGGEQEEVTVGAVMGEDGATGADGGSASPAAGVADDDDGLCVICLTLEKDTAVIPCRHLCLCKECAETLMKHTPKCPVCRGPISQLLHMPK